MTWSGHGQEVSYDVVRSWTGSVIRHCPVMDRKCHMTWSGHGQEVSYDVVRSWTGSVI